MSSPSYLLASTRSTSDPPLLSNISLHDEDDLQRALQRRNLEIYRSREVATVDPLLINTLAAVPSSVDFGEDSSSDSGTVRPTLSTPQVSTLPNPTPASPSFSEIVAGDSGYESDASSPSPASLSSKPSLIPSHAGSHAAHPRNGSTTRTWPHAREEQNGSCKQTQSETHRPAVLQIHSDAQYDSLQDLSPWILTRSRIRPSII